MKRIKAKRKSMNLTQEELAGQVGLYATDVSRLESGAVVYPSHLKRVCNALEIPQESAFDEVKIKVQEQ